MADQGRVLLVVTLSVAPDRSAQVLEQLAENVRGAREDEPGCLRLDVFERDDAPDTFVIVEEYEDAGALEAHRASPHFGLWKAFFDSLTPGAAAREAVTATRVI